MNVALILAGGVGSRVGKDRPKQFIEVHNKPIIAYTIENFQHHPQIDAIAVVCHAQWTDYLQEIVQMYQLSKAKWVFLGGDTFQKSVINGVYALKDKITKEDTVMIHYGAAPFTSEKIITDALRVCKTYGTSVSCTPCYQLMGTNDQEGTSKQWVDRDQLTQIACPQTFVYQTLLQIYEKANEKNLLHTTEPHTTSLMYALGMTLYQSYGDQSNIKITTKEDVELFEAFAYWKMRKTTSAR